MAGFFRTEGIVLKGRDYREADQLLTIATPNFGRVEAIVKGVRKPRSRLRSGTQQLCRSHFLFYAGKNLATVTQCELQSLFAPLRQDLKRLAYAYYLLEVTEAVLLPGQAAPKIYNLLNQSLKLLIITKPSLTARAFEARILKILGLHPQLDICVVCQGPLGKNMQISMSPAAGGVLCDNCQGHQGPKYSIAPGGIKIWQRLNTLGWRYLKRLQISPFLEQQLEEIMPAFLEYYLGKGIRSRAFIGEIGGDRIERTGKNRSVAQTLRF